MFLILGAIVNVAVAWRYSVHWGFPEKPMTSMGAGDQSTADVSLRGVTLTERNLRTGSWESTTWSVQQDMEAGIPFRSMRASRIDRNGTAVNQVSLWEPALPTLGARSFPCGILPLGFLGNTVFYAVVLWLLFAGPFVLRRLRGGRRIRRGLCPKCAYDLRGAPSEKCTECGAVVNRIAR